MTIHQELRRRKAHLEEMPGLLRGEQSEDQEEEEEGREGKEGGSCCLGRTCGLDSLKRMGEGAGIERGRKKSA